MPNTTKEELALMAATEWARANAAGEGAISFGKRVAQVYVFALRNSHGKTQDRIDSSWMDIDSGIDPASAQPGADVLSRVSTMAAALDGAMAAAADDIARSAGLGPAQDPDAGSIPSEPRAPTSGGGGGAEAEAPAAAGDTLNVRRARALSELSKSGVVR